MSSPDLSHALRVATEAAVEGGALIRADFHRPGGPRGAGDHAVVDTEAELLIRARLRAAFPDWGYLGEETGADGPAEAPARWLVDPNDGTRPYLEGFRGSAVSIALVRGDVPVLGVVFAPLAPDDGGDLIAWAEGLPLTGNGVPVERAALPARLERGHVVLVSQDAERSPRANHVCVTPARFRALPSIAYRLALAAAGDAEAAVSLNHPGDWDYAGGQALLRGAGGDLLDEAARPVRYARRRTRSQWCFGGAGPVAAALATREWRTVFTAEDQGPLAAAFPPAALRPGAAVADAGLLRRAQGCLLGQVAGDALGSLVEFQGPGAIRARYPDGVRDLADGGTWGTIAGQPTDDSEMALILARALVRAGGYDPDAALGAYRAWRESGPFDIGATTSAGLAGRPNHGSQANGSLMHISPLGVWAHALPPAQAAELARQDSRLTHPHPVCADACAAFAVAVAHAVRRGDGPEAAYAAALRWAQEAGAEPAVRDALLAAATRPPADYLTQQGWVLVALQNAFYQLVHAPSLEEGVIATVMAGGDTDTNAAIAGALLGAVHGREEVPARWRRLVLTCRPIAGLPGVHRPRPRPFWPVDLPELAELLLLGGAAAAGV